MPEEGEGAEAAPDRRRGRESSPARRSGLYRSLYVEDSHCAYSLSQTDSGWMWRLFDEDGVMIADGSAPDQATAQKGVMAAFWRGAGAEPGLSAPK
jgi:hypothetical protein